MLHAINQNKSNIYKRYLGHRDKQGERVHEEDELTALLLGPLALLPEQDCAAFWHHLLLYLKAPDYTATQPTSAEMSFWPSIKIELNRRIEPDLMVSLVWTDGTQIKLIVELKWRAPLSGDDQLHRQWEFCLSSAEKKTGYHLFIAPETSNALAAKNSELGNIWKGRLLDISWYQLLGMFENLPTNLQPWAKQVRATLEKLRIQRFKGFQQLKPTQKLNWLKTTPIFWKGMKGFHNLPYISSPNNNLLSNQTLFFNSGE